MILIQYINKVTLKNALHKQRYDRYVHVRNLYVTQEYFNLVSRGLSLQLEVI